MSDSASTDPSLKRSGSFHSDDGSHPTPHQTQQKGTLPPAVLVYHESARSIVFRDQLRRASMHGTQQPHSLSPNVSSHDEDDNILGTVRDVTKDLATTLVELTDSPKHIDTTNNQIQIANFQPKIVPLEQLELGPNDQFQPLLDSREGDTPAEQMAVQLLRQQKAVVKTIQNREWTEFLHRFQAPHKARNSRWPDEHDDIPPSSSVFCFNSFVTSTSLLPESGLKMRSYGSPTLYTSGVVFALPEFDSPEAEEEAAIRTKTWSWPAGYSAKTEFNIDSYGNLINGRQEALVSLPTLRQYNDDYVHKKDYMIGTRVVKGGLNTVPYNELFLRVGGVGRIVNGKDCATGEDRTGDNGRSFEKGVGLPIAIFVRSATYGHLISLLRTHARVLHVLGEHHIAGIPLVVITPELGVRVLTKNLQEQLLKVAARNLNPFQNPSIAHLTTISKTSEEHFQQKLEELIDLDDTIRHKLTPEECARLAGGFGATDTSIAAILEEAMQQDKKSPNVEKSHKLQDLVNEGLVAAVRSGDYYTSKQLLILYSLVASKGASKQDDDGEKEGEEKSDSKSGRKSPLEKSDLVLLHQNGSPSTMLSKNTIPPLPPPPPLDTDRLRSATNSDGLLAVLGAAQVLKAMQDGSAKNRTEEVVLAVEEWVEYGEQSMAFRVASWRDQRAAQGDLKIAMQTDASFMAFVSNKAIYNRRAFARQLRGAVLQTDFTDIRFLKAILEILGAMHAPCLRLELLQYVLGLDNRYSVAHVIRSVELAATCLSIGSFTEST